MEISANRQKVFTFFEKVLKERDKFQSVVLKISEFGLVQMTRKRSGQTLMQQLTDECFHCNGLGFIISIQSNSYTILRAMKQEIQMHKAKKIEIQINHEVFNFLTTKEYDAILQLESNLGCEITLLSKKDSAPHNYKIEIN